MIRWSTLLALLALLVLAPAASADTFVVNDTGDAPDAVPADGFCDVDGDGIETDCTLRAAIGEANSNAENDTITFADGLGPITLGDPLGTLAIGTGCIAGCAVTIEGGGDVTVRWSGTAGPAILLDDPADGSGILALRIENAGGSGSLLRVVASTVTLSSLTVAGAAANGIEIGGAAQSVGLSSVAVSGSGADGISISDTAKSVTISTSNVSGSGDDGLSVGGSASDVSVNDSTVAGNSGDGVEAGAGAARVTLSRTRISGNGGDGVSIYGQAIAVTRSPVFGNALSPISLAPGANGGIAPPTLRVGPRRADGSLPITGETQGAGIVELYRGDPVGSQPIVFLDQVSSDGTFSYVPSPEPGAGTTLAATFRDGRGSSRFARLTVPDDIVSPDVSRAVAISTREVRVLFTEPIDPATVEPGDFSLEMAGAPRSVDAVRVEGPNVILSSSGWTYGEAGFVAINGAGAVADALGNLNLGRTTVRVLGAPGDLEPPFASRMQIRPGRICLTAGRRCRRPGATVSFIATEPARAELVIMRGNRRVGVDRTAELRAGANAVRFNGRINGRKLRPGSYRMLLYLEDSVGNRTTEPPIRRFSVVRTTRARRR